MIAFADRMAGVPRSFIREILKVSLNPEFISFAGGLPNKEYFPVREIAEAAQRVFAEKGADVLQYGNSEGDYQLREQIARRYQRQHGINISPESLLITHGSQQGLDLLGKALLNDGDGVLIEEPGYLGAIQSLSLFRPEFYPVRADEHGLDLAQLAAAAARPGVKCMYTVPNFQNPAGFTYPEACRRQVAQVAAERGLLLIEDDPYGELRFSGQAQPSLYHYLPEQTVLLGSFSKTIAPGFRIGWLVAPPAVMEKLLIAKQAADLHTTSVNQAIICRYLLDNDLDQHLLAIKEAYGRQCQAMLAAIARHLPAEFTVTAPEGGMFLWAELPKEQNAMAFFDYAVREKVVFVPGDPFYTKRTGVPALRLSFTCVDPETIEKGIIRLARAYERYCRELARV